MKTTSKKLLLIAFSFYALWFVSINSIVAQTLIQVGTTYNFSQNPQTTARYQLTVPYPGELTIQIGNWLSTYNWSLDFDRIYIYNDTLASIGIGAFGSSGDPFLFHMFQGPNGLVFRVGQAGTYYIDVHSGQPENWGNATSQSYSLTVNAAYCNDIYEPNNDIINATPITVGQVVTAYQWRKVKNDTVWGDEDWYKIQTNSPGVLTIQLTDWVGTYN